MDARKFIYLDDLKDERKTLEIKISFQSFRVKVTVLGKDYS